MGRYSVNADDIYQENVQSLEESYQLEAIDESMTLSEEGMKEFNESYFCYELCSLSESKIQQFLESAECQVMMEKGLIGKKTMVKLSKVDDLERRTGMAAIQLAKEKGDPLYDKLALNRVKERDLLLAINHRYENPAKRLAMAQQKEHIQNSRIPIGYARP